MAYLTPDEEEKQKQGEHPMLAGFGARSSQGGGGGATAVTGSKAPTIAQPSSGFVPFSAYANANQGGAKQMAAGLASDIDQSAGAAQAGVTKERQQFVDQVHKGTPGYQSPAQSLGSWQGLTPQAPREPPQTRKVGDVSGSIPAIADVGNGSTISPEEAKRRAGLGYTGPTEFGFTQGTRDATTKANDQLNALGGYKVDKDGNRTDLEFGRDAGIQTLLQDKYGKAGGYTGGESRLDAALTGNAAGNSFDALRSKYGDLVGKMGDVETGFNDKNSGMIAAAQGGAAARAGAYKGEVAADDWSKAIKSKLPTEPGPTGQSATWYAEHPGDRQKKKFWNDEPMDYDGMMAVPGSLTRDYRPQQNAFRDVFGNNGAAARAVFDSLTTEEWQGLQKMANGKQMHEWLQSRAHDLGVDGPGVAVGFGGPGTSAALYGGA